VLVDGDEVKLIRRRETQADLVRADILGKEVASGELKQSRG